jgi:hypothetical protein
MNSPGSGWPGSWLATIPRPRAEYSILYAQQFWIKGHDKSTPYFNCNLGDHSLFWNARIALWAHPTEQRVAFFHSPIDRFKFVPRQISVAGRHRWGLDRKCAHRRLRLDHLITCRGLAKRSLSVDGLVQLALSFTFICALRH